MLRAFHRWPGLAALVLLSVMAISGAALSLFPASERLQAPQAEAGLSVADLATRLVARYPGLETIRRAPSGRITAWWFEGGTPHAAVIDPATAEPVASADPNPVQRWLTTLHRSLFLGDAGRATVAAGALAMLVLALSGAVLVARRTGGWRLWFGRLQGPWAGRWHVAIARAVVPGLVLLSVTGLWMAAGTFDLLPRGTPAQPVSVEASGLQGADIGTMPLLQQTPVASLRDLSFPYPGDATDAFTLKTDRGTALIDQGTGQLLSWTDRSTMDRVSDVVRMLHTGQGAAVLGLLMGLTALVVPVLGATGAWIWATRPRAGARIRGNLPAGSADTIVLVGSETGSTWGFAATLHAALSGAGYRVHVGPMSAFDPARYPAAQRIFLLAATQGDGQAPASAHGFLERLQALDHAPTAPVAVLGFGDRSFAGYCAYAATVADAVAAKGWRLLLPYETINRQSPQEFARWGEALAQALGKPITLRHAPAQPKTRPLVLTAREDFGAEVQAPTAILRFALPAVPLWQRLLGKGFGRFRPGDLMGILPEGSDTPRLYSLASGSRDGFAEIVVKRRPGGLCSGQLLALEPGGSVGAFVRPNPGFRAGTGRSPLILIGAGTGIGPLAGLIRANRRKRPVHLFFGLRHPESDFLYRDALTAWQGDGRLTRLVTAVSRGARPHYVQDALRADGAEVARLIAAGARVMVCGGRDMAAGVAAALQDILAPAGLSPALLKAEGRYAEDIY